MLIVSDDCILHLLRLALRVSRLPLRGQLGGVDLRLTCAPFRRGTLPPAEAVCKAHGGNGGGGDLSYQPDAHTRLHSLLFHCRSQVSAR